MTPDKITYGEEPKYKVGDLVKVTEWKSHSSCRMDGEVARIESVGWSEKYEDDPDDWETKFEGWYSLDSELDTSGVWEQEIELVEE